MKISTIRCTKCGTIVAENVLDEVRELECPRIGCEETLRLEHPPTDERTDFAES